jgi:DNA-binding NarL/FixJ family response regulator
MWMMDMAKAGRPWRATGREVLTVLRAIEDPAERALAAAAELEELTAQVSAVSGVRLEAVARLRQQGLSYRAIADRLHVTRERAAQLSRDAVKFLG